MQPSVCPANTQNGSADILFKCEHCSVPLVVEKTAAGMTLHCQRCGKPTKVPQLSATGNAPSPPQESAVAKRAELQRHLKENESQRTEINGYINQLSIQLHRWQLRLQTLNERNKQLADEVSGLDRAESSSATG